MKKIYILFITLYTLPTLHGRAQYHSLTLNMHIESVASQFAMEADTSNFTSTITGTSLTPVNFQFKVRIVGDGLLLGQSNLSTAPIYTWNPGNVLTNLAAFDDPLASMNSNFGFKGSLLNGVTPIHSYQMTISLVNSITHLAITDSQTYNFTVKAYSPPTLGFPGNNDTLGNNSYQVNFQWIKDTPGVIHALYYKLTVVPVFSGQSVSTALSTNTPVLNVDSLKDTSYLWIVNGDSIVEDTSYVRPVVKYAWHVYAYYFTGTGLGTSAGHAFVMGHVKPISQGGTFSDSIATLNAKAFEWPYIQFPEFDTLQKTAYGQAAPSGQYKTAPTTLCSNGNWELYSTPVNWAGHLGYRDVNTDNIYFTQNQFDKPGLESRHDIIDTTQSPKYDTLVGGTIMTRVLHGGKRTMRLGAPKVTTYSDTIYGYDGGNAQAVDYKVPLASVNPEIKFWYALVMQYGHHDQNFGQGPNYETEFKVVITGYYNISGLDTTFIPFNNPILMMQVYGYPNDPHGLSEVVHGPRDTILYKNWGCQTIKVGIIHGPGASTINLAGKTVTVQFITATCRPGGHYCYAYIDGLCDNSDPTLASFTIDSAYCPNTYMIADGSASFGATSYTWSMQDVISGSPKYTLPYTIGQPGYIDIHRPFLGMGVPFIAGHHYKVTLEIRNGCDTIDTTQIIHIENLTVNAGAPLQYFCDSGLFVVTLGGNMSSNPAGTTYSWTSRPLGFTSSSPNPTTVPFENTTYILTASNSSCASAIDSTHVYVTPPITSVTGTFSGGSICHGYSDVNVSWSPSNAVPNPANIAWTVTGTTDTIGRGPILTNTSYTNGTTYRDLTVYVKDACGHTKSDEFFLVQTVFTSSSGILLTGFQDPYHDTTANPHLKFYESGLPSGYQPSYNSKSYNMQAINSIAQQVLNLTNTVSGSSYGYANGDLQWNGLLSGGRLPAPTEYYMQIFLTDCNGNPQNASFDSHCATHDYFWRTITDCYTLKLFIVN